jgi:protein TonB
VTRAQRTGTADPGRSSPLGVFLLASVIAHASLLAWWPSFPPRLPVVDGPLSIVLTGAEGRRGIPEGETAHELRAAGAGVQSGRGKGGAERPADAAHEWRQGTSSEPFDAGREAPRPSTSRPRSRSNDSATAASKVMKPNASISKARGKASRPPSQNLAAPTSSPASGHEAKRPSLPVGAAEPADYTVGSLASRAGQASAPAGGSHGDSAEQVRAALCEAILPKLIYPTLARRRGWQGQVKVILHLSAQGRLSGVRIVQTSGHAILDRAAVRDLQRIGELPSLSRWIEGDGLDLEIPVEYRLAAD